MFFKKAVPVWAKELTSDRNIMLCFETEFDYAGKHARIHIAADTLYRMYVNGEFVFYGPQRCGRGWWRVDELDITAKLKKGKNTVCIQVINYGVCSFQYIKQPGFLQAEITIDGVVTAATDINGDFKVKRDLSKIQVIERYSYQRPFVEGWRFPAEYSDELQLTNVEGIRLCGRTAPLPEFKIDCPVKMICEGTALLPEQYEVGDSDRFENPEELDFSFPLEDLPVLYRKHESDMRVLRQTECDHEISETYTFALKENEYQGFRFQRENTGFIICNFECEEDAVVYFIFDEILVDGKIHPAQHSSGTCNLIPLYLKRGKHHFMAVEPMSMQYLKVQCVKGSVKVSGLSLMEYVNPEAKKALFESSDEAINRIYAAAVNTFAQNSVDIFMDCPSRERAGWLCDSFFTARVEKDLTGDSKVEKGFLENFFIATEFPRIPDGMLPMCYPSDELSASFIPNWAMFLVIELEEYIQRTGDTEMAEAAKDRLYKLEKYFCKFLNADGLLEKLDGWVFVEWSQANQWVQDVNFPSNMMYYAMLKAMARMYEDKALETKAEKIKETILRLSFNGTFFRDHMVYSNGCLTVPEDITEVCQYYAFFTGIADKENFGELLKIIADDFGAGHKCTKTHPEVYPANAFIGNYLRMEVLSQNGYRGRIMDEIKDYFDYMALLTGTLWENDNAHASCNHGFASHVVRLIFRDCLGIERIDETHKIIYLNNDFKAPENVKAVLPMKNGSIKVTISSGARKVEITGDYKLGNEQRDT